MKIMASGPITSCQIDGETMETVSNLIFLGSKITADGDCSHEIKRCLLLERKAMTNLNNILKCRNITLLAKVHLVKAVVFPLVMYRCESWTIKKAERCARFGSTYTKNAEHWKIDAFELWCWRRLLRVPWTARSYTLSILKEISPDYSLEGLMLKLKLQYFGHLMQRTVSLEKTLMLGKIEGRRRRGWQMVGWHHHGHEFEQAPGVDDGQGSLECCSLWGRKQSDMTQKLNWNFNWLFGASLIYWIFFIYVFLWEGNSVRYYMIYLLPLSIFWHCLGYRDNHFHLDKKQS